MFLLRGIIFAIRFDLLSFSVALLLIEIDLDLDLGCSCSSPQTVLSLSKALVLLFLSTMFILACWSLGCKRLSLVKRRRSQVAFFAASVRAIYLASVDDNATIGCLFEQQLTGPLFNIKIKPDVDFWLSLLLA